MICPCCGSRVEKNGAVLVSLDSNLLSVAWCEEPIRLRPMQAVLMHCIVTAGPRWLRQDAAIRDMWGAIECDRPEKAFDVHLYQLRKDIAPLGLKIATARGKPPSYRLRLPSAAPTA
jgi:DNA-binding response OmpR family regulator